MNYNEAKCILAGYAAITKEIPDYVREAIGTVISTDIDSTKIRGLSSLNDRKFVETTISTLKTLSPDEQINYFRNLFYQESNDTIEGILASAINSFVTPMLNENLDLKQRIEYALSIAYKYGQAPKVCHKTYTIDQMVQGLIGNETDYKLWVRDYTEKEDNHWSTGIAPY